MELYALIDMLTELGDKHGDVEIGIIVGCGCCDGRITKLKITNYGEGLVIAEDWE